MADDLLLGEGLAMTGLARITLTVAATVAALFATGCSRTTGPSSSPEPGKHIGSSGGAATTAGTGRREAPEPGACWMVSPTKFRPDYWYDDSSTVPCSGRHNLETVLVYDLRKPTPKNAQDLFSLCFTQARVYVGSDLGSWVPWLPAMLLPSREQVARGESWARCDVAVYQDTSFHVVGSLPAGSVKKAVTVRRADVWACTNKGLESGRGTVARFVDCGKPHLLEATGNFLLFDGLASYPRRGAFAAEEGPCRRSLTNQQRTDGLAVKTVWGPPSELRESGDGVLTGICWRFRPDGRLLPPMT
jgi:hypothetical protein